MPLDMAPEVLVTGSARKVWSARGAWMCYSGYQHPFYSHTGKLKARPATPHSAVQAMDRSYRDMKRRADGLGLTVAEYSRTL